jgi:murein L,D-transpeptidase YafK
MAEQDGRTDLGNDIMIHGNAVSTGCLAVGNKAIEELFALAVDTHFKQWKVILAPFDPRIEKEPEISGSAVPSWYQELLAELKNEIEKLPIGSEN